MRAADCMTGVIRDIIPDMAVGKILIQRDEVTAQPHLLYIKLPPHVEKRSVLLFDPMLATGGSVIAALGELKKAGVSPRAVVFVNVVSCPEGLKALNDAYPEVRVVTGAVDTKLNERKFIVPGLGDFGDRYFGTE